MPESRRNNQPGANPLHGIGLYGTMNSVEETHSGITKSEFSSNGMSATPPRSGPEVNNSDIDEADVRMKRTSEEETPVMNGKLEGMNTADGGDGEKVNLNADVNTIATNTLEYDTGKLKGWFRKRHPVDVLPPEIQHIANNIIPLSNVLKFSSQEAYKQLTTMIENLAETSENGEDIKRKREFLHLIVGLREDFVKIYTLVKWAANAKDIGKLIDLLNWFRQQEFYFESLSMGLNELNQYLGAKLPNSDLVTSLEVLIKGRPQLPSYNFLKLPSITPEKTLEVLGDLNLILTTRMAFIKEIPKVYLRNYEIKDGRIYFTVPQQYQVSVTVANSIIIEDDTKDKHSSPFYFIDFQFLFGINPATGCLDDSRGTVSRMPTNKKLEHMANSTLLLLGLTGLHDLLHKYSVSFKVYLLSRQVKEMLIGSTKWKDSLQYKYQHGQSSITINYWCQNYNSRNWKSLVELGVDRNNNVTFRWFKDDAYQHDHQLMGLVKRELYKQQSSSTTSVSAENEGESISEDEFSDINVDLIVTMILNKHAELLMGKIVSLYNEIIGGHGLGSDEFCSFILSHQVCLKLSPSKKTTFALNPLTGAFYFIEPTPLQNEYIAKINSPPLQQSYKRSGFLITETEMCKHIVNHLIQLRLATSNKEINTKLSTTQWIPNQLIKLNEYETNKLYNFLSGSDHSELLQLPRNSSDKSSSFGLSALSLLQFYRRKNWPSSWFLVNLIDGVSCRTYWWVSRIKSIKGEWKIQWVQVLMFDEKNTSSSGQFLEGESKEVRKVFSPTNMGFSMFNSLSTLCSNMIIDHIILEELQAKKIDFVKTSSVDSVLKKYGINAPVKQEALEKNVDADGDSIINESNIIIYNNNNLLQVENSGSSLFLRVTLVSRNNSTVMKLKLFGNLRNLQFKNTPDELKQLSLTINEQDKYFEICDSINLSQTLSGQSEMGPITLSNSSGSSDEKLAANVSIGSSSGVGLLDKIFNNLNKLNELIKILGQVNKYSIPIVNNSINEISVKLDEDYVIKIQLPSNRNQLITLAIGNDSEKGNTENADVMKFFSLVILFLNDYLQGRNQALGTPVDIRGVLMFLTQFLLVFKLSMVIQLAIAKRREQIKLSNGLSKLSFDLRIDNLKQMQLLFFIRYSAGGKKILKDKIVIHLDFRVNKFVKIEEKLGPLLLKLSFKDNLNSKNLKHKELFENMFKSLSSAQGVSRLRYDFLLESQSLSTVFECIAQVFLKHIDK